MWCPPSLQMTACCGARWLWPDRPQIKKRQRERNMSTVSATFVNEYRSELQKTIDTIDAAKVDEAISLFREARDSGRHIFVCGNGGSASTASHFACDIVKGASYNRQTRFKIMALTDS